MSEAVLPIKANENTSSLREYNGIKEIWQDLKTLGRNSIVGDQILSVLASGVNWMILMASKQSLRYGSRKEAPEHWLIELIILVVLRGTFGSVSVRGRSHVFTIVAPVGTVSEVTIGHKQVKPTSRCMSFGNMVLKLTRLTTLKEITSQIYYMPPLYSA